MVLPSFLQAYHVAFSINFLQFSKRISKTIGEIDVTQGDTLYLAQSTREFPNHIYSLFFGSSILINLPLEFTNLLFLHLALL